jgi:hypothetical protein
VTGIISPDVSFSASFKAWRRRNLPPADSSSLPLIIAPQEGTQAANLIVASETLKALSQQPLDAMLKTDQAHNHQPPGEADHCQILN